MDRVTTDLHSCCCVRTTLQWFSARLQHLQCLTIEILQSCTEPSIYTIRYVHDFVVLSSFVVALWVHAMLLPIFFRVASLTKAWNWNGKAITVNAKRRFLNHISMGLVQDTGNSSALAMELILQSYTAVAWLPARWALWLPWWPPAGLKNPLMYLLISTMHLCYCFVVVFCWK